MFDILQNTSSYELLAKIYNYAFTQIPVANMTSLAKVMNFRRKAADSLLRESAMTQFTDKCTHP